MRKLKFSEDQIVSVLRQPAEGVSVWEICRRHGIARQTYYRWRNQYGDLLPKEINRIRQLEDENRRLRRLIVHITADGELLDRMAPAQRRASSSRA
jgi:putative transposase